MATKILVFDPDFSDGVAHTERQLDVYLNDGYQILASHIQRLRQSCVRRTTATAAYRRST